MSSSKSTSATQTTTTADSFNTTNTINRSFDNSGNVALYINSPNAGASTQEDKQQAQTMLYLAIGLGVLGMFFLFWRK